MFENKLNNSDNLTDELLLIQIGQGSKSAFNTLYEKYWQDVYASAYKRLKDTDEAKDIVQEIFTHIWIKRESLHIDNLPAYLNVAVRNKVFKVIAKQKLSHPFFNIAETVTEVQYRPDSNLLTKEFFSAFEALVSALPSKKQAIFRLRFHEDLSTKDIADQLCISRKTVQNQLSRAIEQLKVSLFYLLIVLSNVVFF